MIIIQDATILFVHWRNRSVKVLCKSIQVFASLCKSAKVRTSLFILQESKIIIQYPKILFDISSIRVWKCHASLCKSMHVYASLCNSEQISFFLWKSSDNHLRSDFSLWYHLISSIPVSLEPYKTPFFRFFQNLAAF